jgi:hypothetical protein
MGSENEEAGSAVGSALPLPLQPRCSQRRSADERLRLSLRVPAGLRGSAGARLGPGLPVKSLSPAQPAGGLVAVEPERPGPAGEVHPPPGRALAARSIGGSCNRVLGWRARTPGRRRSRRFVLTWLVSRGSPWRLAWSSAELVGGAIIPASSRTRTVRQSSGSAIVSAIVVFPARPTTARGRPRQLRPASERSVFFLSPSHPVSKKLFLSHGVSINLLLSRHKKRIDWPSGFAYAEGAGASQWDVDIRHHPLFLAFGSKERNRTMTRENLVTVRPSAARYPWPAMAAASVSTCPAVILRDLAFASLGLVAPASPGGRR